MCRLSSLGKKYFTTYKSFNIGRFFNYTEQFRVFVTKMKTSGYMFKLQNMFFEKQAKEELELHVTPVRIEHIYIILTGYLFAMVVAIIFLFIEILMSKKSNRKHLNNQL